MNAENVPVSAENKMVKPVCRDCGSSYALSDAWAEWDIEKQDWVLDATFDHTECGECGSTSIEWREIDER